jgi:hypothetical protein
MVGGRKGSDRAVVPALTRAVALLAREFAKRAADHDRDVWFPFKNFTALKE